MNAGTAVCESVPAEERRIEVVRSITSQEVDLIEQRLAPLPSPQVLPEEVPDLGPVRRPGARAVRRHAPVGQGPERAGGIERLLLEHVEDAPAELTRLERARHRGSVDDLSAADIGEHRTP